MAPMTKGVNIETNNFACEVKFKLGFKTTYTTEMVAKIGLNDPND